MLTIGKCAMARKTEENERNRFLSRRARVCLVSSHGGHLDQLIAIRSAFTGAEVFLITYPGPSRKNWRTYTIPNIGKNPLRMLMGLIKIFPLLLIEKPDLIVSTGSEVAIPAFYLGRLCGSKTIFIESWTRVRTPSGTGRFVYPVSNVFLVQSEKLLLRYGNRARFHGSLRI